MKKTILALTLVMVFPAMAEDATVMKESVKSVVTGVISAGKDALSGVKDGVDDGRKTGVSVDGAVIITDKEELNKFIAVSVLSVTKVADEEYEVTLALRNNSDKAVRLSNLNEAKSLVLLDVAGFASVLKTPLLPGESDITIPDNAAVKARYVFAKVEDAPATLRIYGMDVAVPAAKNK